MIQKRDELLGEAVKVQGEIDNLIAPGRRAGLLGPTVQQMCKEVMLEAKGPLRAVEVKNRVIERWPERDSHPLYNQVFIALRRGSLFKKVGKGVFALRKRPRRD